MIIETSTEQEFSAVIQRSKAGEWFIASVAKGDSGNGSYVFTCYPRPQKQGELLPPTQADSGQASSPHNA